MTTGTYKRGHNLLKLFDELDHSAQTAIEHQHKDGNGNSWIIHGSVRSILTSHKDDFVNWRYLGQKWRPGMVNPYGDDLDTALRALIAAFHGPASKAHT